MITIAAFLADRIVGRAYSTGLRLSSVVCRRRHRLSSVRNVLWLNGAS